MTDYAIKAEHLSKRYFIPDAEIRAPRHIRDAISNNVKRILCAKPKTTMKAFQALDDVSFAIAEGERVGLMGLNGAGKSTLIRILSGITKPTAGRAEIRGRISTVLELGLGFHDELNGRENIYLMGALYGLKPDEIRGLFDSIVDFAGAEQFLNAPIKHYSSGMRARLGFSVAAHLRSDVLLLDEALAVGDAAFQEKCIQKMMAIARNGRTVVLVSHSELAIKNLCTRALLLQKGRLVMDTVDIDKAFEYYAGPKEPEVKQAAKAS